MSSLTTERQRDKNSNPPCAHCDSLITLDQARTARECVVCKQLIHNGCANFKNKCKGSNSSNNSSTRTTDATTPDVNPSINVDTSGSGGGE